MLLDFALYNALDNPKTQTTIRACSAGSTLNTTSGISQSLKGDTPFSCAPAKSNMQTNASMQIAWLDSNSPPGDASENVIATANQMLSYLSLQDEANCNSTILFASTSQATIGFV